MENVANFVEIKFLEDRIKKLDNNSLSLLSKWFIEFENSRWDKQIEADSNNGKLDFLINDALAEHQANITKDL